MKFFGRQYELRLSDPSGDDVTFTGGFNNPYGLDIEFDVEWIGSSSRHGTISITGMSLERIAKYVSLSCLDFSSAADKNLRVTLKAGYSDPGMVDIIDGYAVSGRQSRPPEIKLTLDVEESYVNYKGMFEKGFSTPTKKAEIISSLISPFGLSFSVDENVVNTDKSRFNEKVTLETQFRDYLQTKNVAYTLAGGAKVCCREQGGAFWIIGEDESTPITIGKDDGLLSVDGITVKGVNVSMFLQDHGGPVFPYIDLKSEFNSHADDKYLVTGKHYKGQFRGNSWTTTYECKRVSLR